jgi:hypothetical protein
MEEEHMNITEMRRSRASAGEVINILFGIWVAASPFLLGFSHNPVAMWNNIAVGIALVLVALAGGWGDGALQGLVVPVGIWLFASPFLLGFRTAAFLANNVIMAFIVIAAGASADGLRLPEKAGRVG